MGSGYNSPGEDTLCSKTRGCKGGGKSLESGYVLKVYLTGLAGEVDMGTERGEVRMTDKVTFGVYK